MTKRTPGAALLLAMALAGLALPATAADKADKGGKDTKRLQQRVGSLEQDKARLAQEKTELEGQLKSASEQATAEKQKAEAAARKRLALEKDLKAAEEGRGDLSARLDTATQRVAELEKALADTTAVLRRTEDARRQLDAGLATRTRELGACSAKNEELHRVGLSLVEAYNDKGCFSVLLQKEPFTGLKAASIDNQLEAYREQLDQQRIEQQQEERQKLARQKAAAEEAERERRVQEAAERQKAEQQRLERRKARQQSDIDAMARAVRGLFEGIEW